MIAVDWVAVGSVATAVAVLIAVVGIVVPLLVARRQQTNEEAARLREVIRRFQARAQQLIVALRDGSPLIASADSTVDYVRRQLPDNPKRDEVWEFLADGGNVLRASVVGVATSRSRTSRAEEAMERAAEDLFGDLDLLAIGGRLVVRARQDGGGSAIFNNLLSPEVLEQFKRDDESKSVDELLWKLTSFLQSNAALYFAARYDAALGELSAFIADVADVLSRLDSKRLRAATQARVIVEPSETYTGDMRLSINRLRNNGVLDSTTSSSLLKRVDVIEALLAKDGAAARGAQLTNESDG